MPTTELIPRNHSNDPVLDSHAPDPDGTDSADPADSPSEELPPAGSGFDLADPNSPLAPFYLRLSSVLGCLLLLLIFLLFSYRSLFHSDIWGHMKFGQWMVANGQLNATEPFSIFSDKQRGYVHFQWLAQITFFAIFRTGELLAGGDELHRIAGGVVLLRAFHGLITGLRFAVLLVVFRRWTGSMPMAVFGIVLVLATSMGSSSVQRPQQFGSLCFALLLLPLSRCMISRRALFLVPLLIVVWANLHGSFMVAFVVIGVFLAGRVLEVVSEIRSANPIRIVKDRESRMLAAMLLSSLAAVAIFNPHGPYLFLYVLRMSSHLSISYIAEWQPIKFSDWGYGQIAFLVSVASVAFLQVLTPRWRTPVQPLLMLVFGLPPFFQARILIWWSMVLPLIILPSCQYAVANFLGNRLEYQSEANLRKTVLALGLTALALLMWEPTRWLISGQPTPLEHSLSKGTPWRVAWQLENPRKTGPAGIPKLKDILQKNYPNGEFRGRIFISVHLSDYLMWTLPASMPLMIYSHVHLFPDEHWKDYTAILYAEPRWAEVLEKYRANLLVINPDDRQPLADNIRKSDDWIVILDEAGLQEKVDPMTRLFIAVRKRPL